MAHTISINFPLVFGITVVVLVFGIRKTISWLKITRYKRLRYVIYGAIGVFAASFVVVESLIIFHQTQEPSPSDVIIVLGAGLIGGKPTQTLENRLDRAAEYLGTYPNAIAVVSGGLGSRETLSEAFVMKQYLLEKGIASDRIIMEGRSTTTLENFEFSKIILDEKFEDAYSVSYITNKFHVYRAGLIAKRKGVTASGIAAKDGYVAVPSNYCREYFALMKYFLFS